MAYFYLGKNHVSFMEELLFNTWIKHVFEHPVLPTAWYFDINYDYTIPEPIEHLSHPTVALFIKNTCIRANELLENYSTDQIAQGLQYIFNPSCSDYSHSVKEKEVKKEERLQVLYSIRFLYLHLFEKQALPALSHLNHTQNSLNNICYMFWDISPLAYWEKENDKLFYYEMVLDTLKFALKLKNIACQESALHGLGHLYPYMPKQVQNLILENQKIIPAELVEYSKAASVGAVL